MIKSVKHYKSNSLDRDLIVKNKYSNVMKIPRLDKISLSVNNKEALLNSNKLLIPLVLLKLITGQKPKINKSRKSVAQFKLREGKALGASVTLRKEQLYSFLDKLVFIIFPQLLEQQTKKIKVNNNSLNLGLEDISIFTELESQYELLRVAQGLNITIDLRGKQKENVLFFNGIKIPIGYKKLK